MNQIKLQKGDVVLFHGSGWLSAAIRRFSTSPGEKRPTVFNHVGIIVGEAGEMIEALSTVQRTDFTQRFCAAGQRVLVARMNGLLCRDRNNLALYASRQVGRKYGYGKIAAHFGDWALGQIFRTDIYAFRRLTDSGRYPICSWVVAFAYHKVLLRFCFHGVQPEYCQPDDIGDDILESRRGWWEIVYAHPALTDILVALPFVKGSV